MSKSDNTRRFPDAKSPRPDHYALRVKEAEERNSAWSKLSPKEQLTRLDQVLGKGVGATRQRARIQALLSAPKRADSGPTVKPEAEAKAATKEKAKDRHRRGA